MRTMGTIFKLEIEYFFGYESFLYSNFCELM